MFSLGAGNDLVGQVTYTLLCHGSGSARRQFDNIEIYYELSAVDQHIILAHERNAKFSNVFFKASRLFSKMIYRT